MRAVWFLVAILLSSFATFVVSATNRMAEHRPTQEQREAEIEALLESRKWVFRPVTMQNPELGTTRDIYAYNLYMAFNSDSVTLHLPIESVSYVIYTVSATLAVQNYSSSEMEGGWQRLLFTVEYEQEEWAVEVAVMPLTGETRVAIVAREWTMRYIGSLYTAQK